MKYSFFPLFSSHIDLAHHYWMQIVKKGDVVIDATCGNGKDTLVLARLALDEGQGRLIGLDIQAEALSRTRQLLREHLPESLMDQISLFEQSHVEFPKEIAELSIKLIVYNLGYLPSGDKAITTKTMTTLVSVEKALSLLMPGGLLSITCYPGHDEGKTEEDALEAWLNSLSPKWFSVCQHHWLNRANSPSLILVQKKI
jgi:SAM-dependent methyltransferase